MEDLIARIQRLSHPIEPVSTQMEPMLVEMPELKAVVFDVYGTMIISGSGDISLASTGERERPMREAFSALGLRLDSKASDLVELFHEVIRAHQYDREEEGIEFPEVDIRYVWQDYVTELYERHWLESLPPEEKLDSLAIEYECRVNPVWPMPELLWTLEALEARNLVLGIVSNAQFFTPLFFPALVGASLQELQFSQSCSVWSYQLREGKPSVELYAVLADNLARKEIAPEEALFVGNDMRNDIWPAAEVGLRTALYAGDQRSLRLRVDDPRFGKVQPDCILTSLPDLLEITPTYL